MMIKGFIEMVRLVMKSPVMVAEYVTQEKNLIHRSGIVAAQIVLLRWLHESS